MKFNAILEFETAIDATEMYNELIEDGYLPDEAEREIRHYIETEYFDRICGYADNIFYTPYNTNWRIERVDD